MTLFSFLNIFLFFTALFIPRWNFYNLQISEIPVLWSTMKKLLLTTPLLNFITMITIIPKWYEHILIQWLVIWILLFFYIFYSIFIVLDIRLPTTVCKTLSNLQYQYTHFPKKQICCQCLYRFLYMLSNTVYYSTF